MPMRSLGSLTYPKSKIPNNPQAGSSHLFPSFVWPLLTQSKVLWGPVLVAWPQGVSRLGEMRTRRKR